ncbi:glycosyltransferase family 2 protein [Helicobacter jaachi]|uniref:Glycosyltransferase family 2 protein n=1 Tax=Helicobacter jaachi TaxID=1677920 RepID=A0A4V6I2N6_9HELI|nr:glycosyltransferase family 2 protein [Helicobacter jaachi]TLD96862.1 glycosyltransferase family 2 protein [Helicobacter jaachi]
MPNNPKVSIIIPVFNAQAHIARAIESCTNQSLDSIEIIIVDDCGQDNSIAIAKDYAKRDDRICIVRNSKNLGTFGARIKGIKAARGEYLTFLDADDYLLAQTCKRVYDVAIESGADIVFFGMRFEPKTWKRVSPPVITKPLREEEILYEVFAHCATPPWHICAKLYKASHIARAINLLVAHMGEDTRLTMAEDVLKSFWICALAQKSVGIDDKLYVYCESTSSITRKIDFHTRDRKIADISRVINELDSLSNVPEVRANSAFLPAQKHTINILKSVIALEHRYDEQTNGGGGIICFSPYLRACIKSLAYHRKWQTYVRMMLAILTLGKIKL